jgi:hypothetical protein
MGCVSTTRPVSRFPIARVPTRPSLASQELLIQMTVFAEQLREAGTTPALGVCVFEAGPGGEPADPPDALLEGLREKLPDGHWCKYSELEMNETGDLFEKETGRPARCCWVTIHWITDDRVEVEKGFRSGPLFGAISKFELTSVNGQWQRRFNTAVRQWSN